MKSRVLASRWRGVYTSILMANLPTIFLLFQALVQGFLLRNNQAKRVHALPANSSIGVFDMVCQI